MATLDVDILSLSRSAYRGRLRREVSSCTVGSATEWHVFHVFVSYIEDLIDRGIDFAVRPFGAIIFGSCKDRTDRKSILTIMLLLVGWATFAVTLDPSHETIGVWCAVILTVVRFIRGRSPHSTE